MTLRSKRITIASGKGGVGKTWLSVTLAAALAKAGRKVLVFDGDLGLANVDVQLGLSPKRDLADLLGGNAPLDACVTRYDGAGFDVLAGRSGTGTLANISAAQVAALNANLAAAEANYDHIILDMAAGIDAANMQIGSHPGPTLIVLTADPTSLTDAYALMKLRHRRDPGADLRIVVNNAPDKEHATKAYNALRQACENFLGLNPPLQGTVYSDTKVADAIRHQRDLFSRHPQAQAAKQVSEIARQLVAESNRQSAPTPLDLRNVS